MGKDCGYGGVGPGGAERETGGEAAAWILIGVRGLEFEAGATLSLVFLPRRSVAMGSGEHRKDLLHLGEGQASNGRHVGESGLRSLLGRRAGAGAQLARSGANRLGGHGDVTVRAEEEDNDSAGSSLGPSWLASLLCSAVISCCCFAFDPKRNGLA